MNRSPIHPTRSAIGSPKTAPTSAPTAMAISTCQCNRLYQGASGLCSIGCPVRGEESAHFDGCFTTTRSTVRMIYDAQVYYGRLHGR